MPLYEYECQQCRKHTEKIQKFSDPEITTCPHCGGALKRVITAPAFALKGGGWYADGYGSAKPATGGDAAAAPAGESAKSESGKPDGAPAAAPASSPAPVAAAHASTSSTSAPAKD